MTGPSVRDGTPADLDALERLEKAAFDADRLSRRSLRRFLLAPTTAVPVALAAGQVAGYAMIGFRAGSAVARLFSLAVDAAHARQGLGRALLRACEGHAALRRCRVIRLEVRADNHGAIRLYAGSGYREFGRYADYYDDGAAALRFEKAVGPQLRPGPEPN